MVNAQKRGASAKSQVAAAAVFGLIGVGAARHFQPYECPICGFEFFKDSPTPENAKRTVHYCWQCSHFNKDCLYNSKIPTHEACAEGSFL
jgi:hypothetical protein